MINLLTFILACAGTTQILCYGKIFDKLRPSTGFISEMLKCSMCTGTHVGYIMFTLFWISGVQLFNSYLFGLFIFSMISAYTSYFLDKIISDEGINTNKTNKQQLNG